MTTTPVQLTQPSHSRFSGRQISDLLGTSLSECRFDTDVWDLAGHPQMASLVKRRIYFDSQPSWLRDPMKEFVVLATQPARHSELAPEIAGIKSKNIKTVIRWISDLVTDLSWLRSRSGSLALVTQDDYDAWRTDSGLNVDYRRIGGVKAFHRYCSAMSPNLDRLANEPWPGQSALSLDGGKPDPSEPTSEPIRKSPKKRANSTPTIGTADLAPSLLTAMVLVDNAATVIGQWQAELATGECRTATLIGPDGNRAEFTPATDWATILRLIGPAAMFVTAAFTGMRASELDAIPRYNPLDAITVGQSTRWLLASYLVKGMRRPVRESWLVPPTVARAVEATTSVLQALEVGDEVRFASTGQAPLFDRRLSLSYERGESARATMRLERALTAVQRANAWLVPTGLVTAHTAAPGTINGRTLRRTFTRIVSERPSGPQAAMDQFKWQRPETAAGYFRLQPDAVAVGQREVYNEINELQTEGVTSALVDEFTRWERAVERGEDPLVPAGPDGRRKRDLFAAIKEALTHEPRVEEDDRRLRELFRAHAETMMLTEFGWCDYDPALALCSRGETHPVQGRCEPNRCLNHATTWATLPAHQVKHERLLALAKDRRMPKLARDQANERAKIIENDLGTLLGEATDDGA